MGLSFIQMKRGNHKINGVRLKVIFKKSLQPLLFHLNREEKESNNILHRFQKYMRLLI